MEQLELINLWKLASEKMEENILINKKNTEDLARLKVHTLLVSMKPIKIFTLLISIAWVIIVGRLIIYQFSAESRQLSMFLLISAAIQLLITAIAIALYLYQLATLYQVDISGPVIATQKRLAKLKYSMLLVVRILCLQLPVWTTFWWNQSMFRAWNFGQWCICLGITACFSYLAIWLFFNINYKNHEKKWFKLIFKDSQWKSLMKVNSLLEQTQVYDTVN